MIKHGSDEVRAAIPESAVQADQRKADPGEADQEQQIDAPLNVEKNVRSQS